MKKIALDLDGVVFDSENLYRVYTEIYDVDILKGDFIKNNEERTHFNRYNWTDFHNKKFYEKYSKIVLTNAPLKTGIDIVLPKLKENFEFIIITSRSEEEVNYGMNKLKEIGLNNVKIYFNEHHKINRLKKEKCDYIIDDDKDICLNAKQNNIKSIYFKNSASSIVKELVTVNNWGEIYKFLMFKEGNN